MSRILVTGGAGFIGSHTAKALSRAGFEPVVLDDLSRGHRWAVRWGPSIEGNLADCALLRGLLCAYRIEAVLHFAAHANVAESMRDPRSYFRDNVANALNLLDAMRDSGVMTVVFSSTCATYGIPEMVPLVEDHLQLPANPYGGSKLFIERALKWYGLAYGIRWLALRYFNAAGADPDAEIGEEHDPETHLIPLAIEAALGNAPALEVYGTDYSTPDGTAIRDYVHVSDLAEAHVAALRYLLDRGPSRAFNLGTGSGHSVREVIAVVERVIGRGVRVREAPRRPGDPPKLVASPSESNRILQWQPCYSAMETIVETALGWYTSSNRPRSATGRGLQLEFRAASGWI